MQEAAKLNLTTFGVIEPTRERKRAFVVTLLVCTLACAALASWIPLQVSIVTVFVFAGPHNWFELRYFLMRLPVRFGKSRKFFLTAFAGLGLLTVAYVSLPLIYQTTGWSYETGLIAVGIWNTLLLGWLSTLVWLRGRQKLHSDWSWFFPIALALCAFNWLTPELFSLSLVYLHPLVALWFLDKHLQRNRPHWLTAYRRCLALVPVIIGLIIWQLWGSRSLVESNGLFWRITQHSGADLFPQISSHLLVSVHLFLELLHYGVWLFALPLWGPLTNGRRRTNPFAHLWQTKSIPVARHPRGFPKLIAFMLTITLAFVLLLWLGFSVNYATTRDIYFTLAIAHVIAEAPFLLKML
ncbi:MAG TPA: hypothetical protein VLE19_02225 [Pyrinomonadaceae bacterium]|nr:hypothetical protein [Pyrinomonadaceae bacterium]